MEDLDTVYDFAKQFYEATPYSKTYEFSETRLKEVIRIYLESPKTAAITVLLTKDEVPVGVVAGVAAKSLFSDGVHTVEQIWWVDPHHRNTRYSLGLIKAFEDWSRQIGASHCIVASIREVTDLTRLYNKLGYEEHEQAFLKKLGG